MGPALRYHEFGSRALRCSTSSDEHREHPLVLRRGHREPVGVHEGAGRGVHARRAARGGGRARCATRTRGDDSATHREDVRRDGACLEDGREARSAARPVVARVRRPREADAALLDVRAGGADVDLRLRAPRAPRRRGCGRRSPARTRRSSLTPALRQRGAQDDVPAGALAVDPRDAHAPQIGDRADGRVGRATSTVVYVVSP